MRIADAACVIVAGGRASRLGNRVKALVEIDGQTILDRMLAVLRPRMSAIAIAANDPEPYRGRDLPVLPDETLGQGPLAGILSGLRWCRRPYLLALPCDLPYLDGRAVDLLLSRRAPGVDQVVPFVRGLPEPLFALYAPRCLPVLERRLEAGELKAGDFARDEGLTRAPIHEVELRAVDPDLRFLTNINSPTDLERA